MPTDQRRQLHSDRTRLPILPDRRQPSPKEPISGRQLRPLHRPLQNTELMTKGQNLKLKRHALAKEAKKAAASATNGGEHGNRRKKDNPQFISKFEICENHNCQRMGIPLSGTQPRDCSGQ